MGGTILITSGYRFIGSYLYRLMVERGDKVVDFDLREPNPESALLVKLVSEQVQFVQGSMDDWPGIVDAIDTHRPEAIAHTAVVVNPVLLNRQPTMALKVNMGGVFNILETARLFEVGWVAYLSSIGVLSAVQYRPLDVNHPELLATEGPGPCFYGAAKVGREAFCWACNQSFGLD